MAANDYKWLNMAKNGRKLLKMALKCPNSTQYYFVRTIRVWHGLPWPCFVCLSSVCCHKSTAFPMYTAMSLQWNLCLMYFQCMLSGVYCLSNIYCHESTLAPLSTLMSLLQHLFLQSFQCLLSHVYCLSNLYCLEFTLATLSIVSLMSTVMRLLKHLL